MDTEQVVEWLEGLGDVRAKRMFGGHGLYLDELFFGLISREGRLYFKTDEATRGRYEELAAEPFQPFPDGKRSMNYHELPLEVLEDPARRLEFAREAVEAARRKPAKKSKRASAQGLSNLKNVGKVSARWLRDIGVKKRSDLEALGSVAAFRAVEARGHAPSLNLLYALEGALLDVHWNELPEPMRAELRRAVGRG